MTRVLEAGAALSHIRAEICKAVRAGAERSELVALLLAEERAQIEVMNALTQAGLQ